MTTLFTVKILERDRTEWIQCIPYTTRKKCEDKIATLSIHSEYRLESRTINKKQTIVKDTVIIQNNQEACIGELIREARARQAIKNYIRNIEVLEKKRSKCKTIEEIIKKNKQIEWCKKKMKEYEEILEKRG